MMSDTRRRYTYGPVPSRRLGRSLGVSPIPPKTCSYTCVYCQLGRTSVLSAERKSFFSRDEILEEILDAARNATFDYVTFVGDGEPTLCKDLGWLIDQTNRRLTSHTAVITNGSLLFRDDVRSELRHAEVVMPTLDAGNERTFRAVNRPHRDIRFEAMLTGLIQFRREYAGKIWLEVMLLRGLNDSNEELVSIAKAVAQVSPDRVYIVTPIRPPAEAWVSPPAPETIIKAQHLIQAAAPIVDRETGEFNPETAADPRQAILDIGSRHPLRLDQVTTIERKLGVSGVVDKMLAGGELIRVDYGGAAFVLPGFFVRGSKTVRRERKTEK